LKVLVTGSDGFIGSHVVDALRKRGADVATLTRPADYHDAAVVEALLRDEAPHVLVHCAWKLAPGSAYLEDPANADEAVASLRLFQLAQRAGCGRVVGLGTCLEYAESEGPVAEDAPLEPRTPYGESKAELFRAAEAWATDAGASFAWARLYFPFGPREAPYRLVPSVVNGLLRKERVATTPGTQHRSFLYAADVGDAIATIALCDLVGAVNVGADGVVAVRHLVERIAALIGRPDLLDLGALPHRPGDPDVLWPDVSKLSSLGWTPAHDLDGGLSETIGWWRRTLDAQPTTRIT
jgi:nucleoside-diphosphate-sugar epimerase